MGNIAVPLAVFAIVIAIGGTIVGMGSPAPSSKLPFDTVAQGTSTITVGASPFTYQNNDGVFELVYLTDNTAYTVVKNSVTIFNGITGSSAVGLYPLQSITVSFVSPPSMAKDVF